MSSLLQFSGKTDRKRGVGLLFCREAEVETRLPCGHIFARTVDAETERCPRCGGQHGILYQAWRKPAGMWGCWVVFRYNGEEHVPDLSVPISIGANDPLPRGAKRLSAADSAAYWHS